ncbi:MAG: acyltransferase family protein [Methylosarcina sp.]
MPMNRWQSVQTLRGIAVLGIVGFHAMAIEKKYSGGDRLLPDFFRLGQSGVDLFFVISGFVIMSVTRGRFGCPRETLRFLWGRLTRIYPAYWFYFFLTAAIFFIRPGWVNTSQGRHPEFISSFFLLPADRLPLVMVAWTLIHELWFYLVFSVLLTLNERRLLPSLLLWGAIVTTVNVFAIVADFPAGVRIILHPYTLEFIIGALVFIFISSERGARFSSHPYLPIIGWMLPFGLALIYHFDVLKEANLLRVGIVGALYGFLLLFLTSLEREKKFLGPGFLHSIGDCSYSIYLSHVLVLSAIGRLWLMVGPDRHGLIDNLLACLIMLAAVVIYGAVGYRLIEQPILRVSHRLRARWFDNDGLRSCNTKINSDTVR